MTDDARTRRNLEALQARHVGTGSADTSAAEWQRNMARDSLSSFVGHPPLLQYMSIGLGQTREQTRVEFIEKMVFPAGNKPKVNEEKVKEAKAKATAEWEEEKVRREKDELFAKGPYRRGELFEKEGPVDPWGYAPDGRRAYF